MEMTVQHSKYFKEFDDTDNECCWQVSEVSTEIGTILKGHGIKTDFMPEDWGSAYTWADSDIAYSLMITCIDVEAVRFALLFEAFARRWLVFRRLVDIEDTPYAYLVGDFDKLNEAPHRSLTTDHDDATA